MTATLDPAAVPTGWLPIPSQNRAVPVGMILDVQGSLTGSTTIRLRDGVQVTVESDVNTVLREVRRVIGDVDVEPALWAQPAQGRLPRPQGDTVTTTRLQLSIPNSPDEGPGKEFTAAGAASLIGQRPRWATGLDWSKAGPRATVVDAVLDGDNLMVTVDVDERAVPECLKEPILGGLGFSIAAAQDCKVASAEAKCIGPLS